jgi:hypothetical protein
MEITVYGVQAGLGTSTADESDAVMPGSNGAPKSRNAPSDLAPWHAAALQIPAKSRRRGEVVVITPRSDLGGFRSCKIGALANTRGLERGVWMDSDGVVSV